MQNTVFSTNKTLNVNGRLLSLDEPKVMGILNVTPDSFYDGGRFVSGRDILRQAEKMLREQADIIDVGGYSSRPGAESVTPEEETDRVVKALRMIVREFPGALISVDTFRSDVARAAVQEGASIINDISGGGLDPKMFETAAALQVPYVLMHMRGNPQTMATLTAYDDLLKEMLDYFHTRLFTLKQLGVRDIIIDPGFGFAKSGEQNFRLLNELEYLKLPGHPLMVGLSRKSLVWKTLGTSPDEALNGSTALNAIAVLKGAGILRVHDVKEAREVISLVGGVTRSQLESQRETKPAGSSRPNG